jgi:exodeoxyribonuclease VII small subunit
MTQDQKPDPPAMRFGETLEELEDIVRALEGGRLDLEDSLKLYQRGVALLTASRAKLDDAEQQVTMLLGQLESHGESDADDATEGVVADEGRDE